MSNTIKDAIRLMPIVEKAAKALYGKAIQNVRIMKAEQFPLFKEPKQGWMVHAEFDDEQYNYSVQMDVQMSDGRITRSVELHRLPLTK
ncbi:MAG: hypothetical protein JSV74_00395 [Dehalococcoidia bacterium]|nr:MAG: hypothetical protein JSV74_00395 [Dehalococcoidia bacterium]